MGSFKLKLVLYFALLALLPVAAVFYGYDTLVKRSETRRVDARLEAGLRGSLAAYTSRLDEAERAARALAGSPDLQQALRRKDRPALEAIAAQNPLVSISGRGVAVGGRRVVAAKVPVDVIDHGLLLGSIVLFVPVDDGLLHAISSGLDPSETLVAARAGR